MPKRKQLQGAVIRVHLIEGQHLDRYVLPELLPDRVRVAARHLVNDRIKRRIAERQSATALGVNWWLVCTSMEVCFVYTPEGGIDFVDLHSMLALSGRGFALPWPDDEQGIRTFVPEDDAARRIKGRWLRPPS